MSFKVKKKNKLIKLLIFLKKSKNFSLLNKGANIGFNYNLLHYPIALIDLAILTKFIKIAINIKILD